VAETREAVLSQWCAQHLGHRVQAVLFRAGYFAEVVGVVLRDGTRAVVKIRQPAPRLAGCARVHAGVHRYGFPTPELILPPVPYPDGRIASAEALVEPADGHGTASASALLLTELVHAAPAVADASLAPAPAWVRWDHDEPGLWPTPDDQEVDLNSRPVAWIDAIGQRLRPLLQSVGAQLVVGHCDWTPDNVWWKTDGTPLAVLDWDSAAQLPEPALAGVAAAIYEGQTTVEQSAAFLLAYRRTRADWSAQHTALAWAAGLWVLLFDAKKDLLCGRTPTFNPEQAYRRLRLALSVRRTTDLLLRPISHDDIDRLVSIETDPRTTRHSPTGVPTPGEAAGLVASAADAWEVGEVGYWAVEHQGQVIGAAGLRLVTLHGRQCWNLYYRLSPVAWGQGLGTQAAQEAVAYAAEADADMPVVARTRPANTAAQRVALAAGLQPTPELDSNGFHTFAHRW
jgi:RimJ/RimL family protein N-acetyltransferase